MQMTISKHTLILILITIINVMGYSQNTPDIHRTILNFNEALINKNLTEINKLTHPHLSYGHSNAWIETKKEFLQNIQSNYIQYKSIKCDTVQIIKTKKIITARYNAQFTVSLKDKPIDLTLHVCQTWIKRHGHWVLLSRQSTKI
jgi:hypothetical protein